MLRLRATILGVCLGLAACQGTPGNEGCHDEVTVYTFTRSSKPGMVTAQADKIVNGEALNMGVMDLVYSDKDQCWEFDFSTRVHGLWTFQATGRDLTALEF